MSAQHQPIDIAICFSGGIRAIRHIESLLGVNALVEPGSDAARSAMAQGETPPVLVWGHKPGNAQALAFATQNNLPLLYLEDGFIRTCSEDAHSRLMYSITADTRSPYYDSQTPSSLELFLKNSTALRANMLSADSAVIVACRELMVTHNVTKYNFCRELGKDESIVSLLEDSDRAASDSTRPVVLVIDQTVGDASIVYGGADRNRFLAMLDSAITENPDALVVVKTHPDVVAGKRQGYLTDAAVARGVPLLTQPINSMSVIKRCQKVYVATSQAGFEALLCKVPVVVFGRPFYAGWGLTDDRAEIPSRGIKRTLDELFYAAMIWYPEYCNPVTGQSCSLPECLSHVLLQKKVFTQNAKHFLGIGITPWKRRYVQQYLRSPHGSVSFPAITTLFKGQISPEIIDQQMIAHNCDAVVTWSYRVPGLDPESHQGSEVPIYRIEDGFIRSSGLGSDFSAPSSLVIDSLGLYFNARHESEIERLLNTGTCSEEQLLRAEQLISLILSARLSKYNVGRKDSVNWPSTSDRKKLLVVGQVESDASIRFGCSTITSNAQLLEQVRRENPDAFIVYKPHPDVVAGNRAGGVPDHVMQDAVDALETEADIVDCIEATDELHTMTSLSGFEALLRQKKVVTYGTPFYSGWGLTTDKHARDTRTNTRSLEELVYFVLIAYPRYMDMDTGEFATPEDIVETIRSRQMKNKTMNWSDRQINKLVNVFKGLIYAP